MKGLCRRLVFGLEKMTMSLESYLSKECGSKLRAARQMLNL